MILLVVKCTAIVESLQVGGNNILVLQCFQTLLFLKNYHIVRLFGRINVKQMAKSKVAGKNFWRNE